MTFEEWWLSLPEDVRRMSNGCCVAASQSAWQAAWQAAQPKWRPIETAPTSGTFIAWAGGRPFEAYYRQLGEILTAEGDVVKPTHWQPMPEPPHE